MRRPPLPSDPDAGVWRGRSVARAFRSPDGLVVLVGRSAEDNDTLTLELAAPDDFWLHVAGASGSHVVVRNPGGLDRLPRDTLRFAAALAVRHSKARGAPSASVHVARRRDVGKRRGQPPGEVELARWTAVTGRPADAEG
ncbi:MAG TPA: NFACT RNA binding domain-containing protein [Candidatus Binatia bacterium]|nr:NFACT RNA binding domain-containing protein [Candidatus Binatia bacterium]